VSNENADRDRKESAALSKREIEAYAGASADEKTLLLPHAPAPDPHVISDDKSIEQTHRFVAPSEAPTAIQNASDTEPTKILAEDKTGKEEIAPNPKRYGWRFALVCALYALAFVNYGLNVSRIDLTSPPPPFNVLQDGERLKVNKVSEANEGAIQVGDELVSLNGRDVKNYAQLNDVTAPIRPGDRVLVALLRDGQLLEVEGIIQSQSLREQVTQISNSAVLPVIFLLIGLLVFLFKPNDERAFLLALLFCVQGAAIYENSPLFFKVTAFLSNAYASFFPAFLLHLSLIFPDRSPLLKRFPRLTYLIYIPILFFSLPYKALIDLNAAGWSGAVNFNIQSWFFPLIFALNALYVLAALAVLVLTYVRADTVARRKLRLLIAAFLCCFLLGMFLYSWLEFFSPALKIRFPYQDWGYLILPCLFLMVPSAFAYAIVRHKVIPVSFVIRRGLQYLLAKNALRLLLILPVLGILWNIAANPNRTIGEILLNNSYDFYACLVLGVGLLLINRFGLDEWVDRKFFREQYNQEKVLRELAEVVKESDSMPTLSRLVSSKIQSALHPENVYLFFRDDAQNSDFSLGYTTFDPRAVASGSLVKENSPANADGVGLKLAADSPLLRFMERLREAVNFPSRESEELPSREKTWLKQIGANLLVPMHGTDGRLAGFFSLGEKLSEIPYTGRDKELLETLAHQIALVHENLNLKDRVRREQRIKTEVLSRFDEGKINLLKECPRCGRCYDRKDERCGEDNSELTFTLPVERTIENRYRLEKLLGKGGMGAVYEATDTRINRSVAVKILSGAMFGNRDALRRFEREALTAGRLQHSNIVTVFDYGVLSTEGAFLVMELFRGESLRQILDREGQLDAETIVAWFGQILDGVEAAHKQGVIHRDLTPNNILVSRSENDTARLCILDFGLARLNDPALAAQSMTVPGTVLGTFGYMAPEQLRGEKMDERSDLFAVGVMIYEALYGEKPFRGSSYQELLRAMTSDEYSSELDKRLTKFLAKSLALDPAARFASASEMKRILSMSDFATQ
jgi:eukaryotic-like serine/threonine-protein kinase